MADLTRDQQHYTARATAKNDAVRTVQDLIAYPTELPWLEFKENWFEPHVLGEYIAALSNAAALAGHDYGYMVWGVNDGTHEIVGTNFVWYRNVKGEPLEHYLARQLSPSIAFEFDEAEMESKRIVLLTVPAAKSVPTSFDGVRYQRVGSSKVNLTKHPEREMQLFKTLIYGPATAENIPADYQDLTFLQLFTYHSGRGIELRKETFAKNLGLLTADGTYNMLAQLLSDNSHAPVRVALFAGSDKTSTMYHVQEFGYTCLLLSLDKVLAYGDVLNVPQADERDRGFSSLRKEVPLFDAGAFREAAINAFVHNDWSDGNAPMFTVYNNRIEILSRGTLAPKQTVEGFFNGDSVPVNKALSDMILQLHISERTGRGVPRIVEAYGRGCYEFRDNAIVVTIPFHRIDTQVVDNVSNKPGLKPGLKPGYMSERPALSDTQRRVVEELRDNPNVTQRQLMKSLGLARSTIQEAMVRLREMGIIERVGSRKTGWWRVLK